MPSVATAELRIAVRTLLKARGFTAAAVFTLGLGLTLAAAVLLVVNAYLLRTLPYPGASRLYSVRYAPPGERGPRDLETLDWTTLGAVIEHPIAWDLDVFYLTGSGPTEPAPGAWVTPGFVQALGIQPAVGRGFEADAFLEGAPQVALISHRLWQNRFGADPAILGRRFEAYVSDRPDEAETFTIIGVLPAGFWHVNPYTDVLAPLRADTYPYMVRLREGVSPSEAAARITALVRAGTSGLRPDWQADLVSTHAAYVERMRPVLRTAVMAAGVVLLIGWANVAGLLLVRAARRQREMAVRVALGAGRMAVARLVIVEGLVLALAATLIGLAGSALAMPALAPPIERELGRPAPGGTGAFAIDATVIAGMAVFGLLTAGVCALVPLAATWRRSLQSLHGGSRTATEGRASLRARSALIAVEVAASLALLAGSTLMIQSVVRLLNVDLGIRADRVLSASVTLRQRSYPEARERLAFYDRLVERLGAVPGVRSAALGDWFPLQQPRAQEIEAERGGVPVTASAPVLRAGPGLFELLGVAVVSGRGFTEADSIGSEPVALVSETLAARLWPEGRALGQRVRPVENASPDGAPPASRVVVGVVRDVRQSQTDADLADLYVPLREEPSRFAMVYLATSGSPTALAPAVIDAVAGVDPSVALNAARPLQAIADEQLARPRFIAALLAGAAVIAALLALVGVYGVIAYAVRQREREIALRLAIGADPGRITSMFVKQGAVLLAAGLAIGLVGAAGVGRLIESQLFGVEPSDPSSLAMAVAAFASAGLVAVWWPARRAASTDPAGVLKEE